jgi:hypothetical protein
MQNVCFGLCDDVTDPLNGSDTVWQLLKVPAINSSQAA